MGKIWKVARWIVLVVLLFVIFLMLTKPAPVALPQAADEQKTAAQSFESKLGEAEQARSAGESPAPVHLSSDEINGALAESAAPAGSATAQSASANPAAGPAPSAQNTQVTFEGDVVRGQFLTQLYGKDVYVTVAGHLGARDGYVTFQPTEFKIGNLSVPVSLVDSRLQAKLAEPETHEKLKLPDFVSDIRVENGELVITPK